jgi:hypothetical protein
MLLIVDGENTPASNPGYILAQVTLANTTIVVDEDFHHEAWDAYQHAEPFDHNFSDLG